MTYLLLAWSQGNVAARSGDTIHSCPYRDGRMREAWLKGFDFWRQHGCVA